MAWLRLLYLKWLWKTGRRKFLYVSAEPEEADVPPTHSRWKEEDNSFLRELTVKFDKVKTDSWTRAVKM